MLNYALVNRLKIKRYVLNYRSGDRFLFNDLFRILLERNSAQVLLNILQRNDKIFKYSSNIWVFKILIYLKLGESQKIEAAFNFLMTENRRISPYYFELNIFREAYEYILPSYSLKNLRNLFKTDTEILLRKFIIGHTLCVTEPEKFVPELIQFQAEINQSNSFSSELYLLEITDIEAVCSARTEVKPSYSMQFQEPKCFGDKALPLARSVPVPAAIVWTIKDCQLIGASQITKDKKFIVYEKSGDPKIGFIAGIWNFVIYIKNSNHVLINRYFKKINHHKSGVLIAGRCSQNYFHWLIEYVPKILNILAVQKLDSPLIVDATMPEQSYAILDFICKKYSLKYIRTNPEELLNFDELIVPSQHTFQPDDPAFSFWESSALSFEHLEFISNIGLEMALQNPISIKHDKIYLTRKNFTARKIVNEKEIECLFQKHDFHIIDPTSLSFVEQVQLFANAKIIASPTGAALSNLIFCQANTQILSLVASENKGFCIQANIAKFKKLNFMHITGDLVQKREAFNSYQEYRFSEFQMDLPKLEQALLELEI